MKRNLILFCSVFVLDFLWLLVTNRLQLIDSNYEALFFAVCSRVLVYVWIAYTVIPSIMCHEWGVSVKTIAFESVAKGLPTFALWNFANVETFEEAPMPLADTLWGVFMTFAATFISLTS